MTDASGGRDPVGSFADFRAFDFDALWQGRSRVTAVEGGVLLRCLDGGPSDRVLELGPGGGRLTPILRARFREYVAADLARELLVRLGSSASPTPDRVVADAHRLPFRSGTFSAIVLIRVLEFLPSPERAISEMARCLAPGGRLVLGYFGAEWLRSAAGKIGPVQPTRPTPRFRAPVGTGGPPRIPASLYGALARSELRRIAEYRMGLEEYPFARELPASLWIRSARVPWPADPRPHRFVVAVRT